MMNFSEALTEIKEGQPVARTGWNGKGMCVFLVAGSTFKVNREPLLSVVGEGQEVNYRDHLDMVTADKQIVVWTAAQSDILADDWELAELTLD